MPPRVFIIAFLAALVVEANTLCYYFVDDLASESEVLVPVAEFPLLLELELPVCWLVYYDWFAFYLNGDSPFSLCSDASFIAKPVDGVFLRVVERYFSCAPPLPVEDLSTEVV